MDAGLLVRAWSKKAAVFKLLPANPALRSSQLTVDNQTQPIW